MIYVNSLTALILSIYQTNNKQKRTWCYLLLFVTTICSLQKQFPTISKNCKDNDSVLFPQKLGNRNGLLFVPLYLLPKEEIRKQKRNEIRKLMARMKSLSGNFIKVSNQLLLGVPTNSFFLCMYLCHQKQKYDSLQLSQRLCVFQIMKSEVCIWLDNKTIGNYSVNIKFTSIRKRLSKKMHYCTFNKSFTLKIYNVIMNITYYHTR